jgi:hypothetical protein
MGLFYYLCIMVKGNIKEELMSVAEIMSRTNQGFDIFRAYLPKVARCMNRPWGKKETKPSWGVYPSRNSIWVYKDNATGETGSAITFVSRMFGLTTAEALTKICYDFGFGGKYINATPVKVTWEKPDIEKEYCDISIITQPFGKKHHEFWNAASVTEEHCKKYNCYAIKSLAINKRNIPFRPDEIVFAYHAPEEDLGDKLALKVYFPERQDAKFKNNISGHYLWNSTNVKQADKLIIQKSMKDLLVTTLITPNVVATQNESAGIFDEEMVNKIKGISPNVTVWYGSDSDGVEKCKKITNLNGWKYLNTPKNLLPEINDAYGFVKKFGIKALEEFMKSKNII